MTTFAERTEEQKDIIRKAYKFEIKAIKKGSAERNPYKNTILTWVDGAEAWEAVNVAVELAYS